MRAQTLYAYVSRGRIGMRPDGADPRRSQYRADDIAALASRRARGRNPQAIAESAIAWGEPAIATTISTVLHGRLIYRGQDAVALCEAATLEQTANLLWASDAPVSFVSASRDGNGATGRPAAFVELAALAANGRPSLGRRSASLNHDAAGAIAALAQALGAIPGTGAVHERLARGWSLDAAGADLIRRSLVLLADHELNASTFAARVAASTGAPVSACLLAGLATLSGPRHGAAAEAVMILGEDAQRLGPGRPSDAGSVTTCHCPDLAIRFIPKAIRAPNLCWPLSMSMMGCCGFAMRPLRQRACARTSISPWLR